LAPPTGAFYVYPDLSPLRPAFRPTLEIETDGDLAARLLEGPGIATLPGSAFGDDPTSLRLRVATSMLYGDTDELREACLASADPVSLPWVSQSLARLRAALAWLVS
jgi:aspartate/methionine/tyrosine aminotransferase